jgi:hypothetical protein
VARRKPTYTVEKFDTTTVLITPVSVLVEQGRIRKLPDRPDGWRLFETVHRPGPARHHPGRVAARVFQR